MGRIKELGRCSERLSSEIDHQFADGLVRREIGRGALLFDVPQLDGPACVPSFHWPGQPSRDLVACIIADIGVRVGLVIAGEKREVPHVL